MGLAFWSSEVCVRVMIQLSPMSFKNPSPIKPASQTLVQIVMKTKWLQEGECEKQGKGRVREKEVISVVALEEETV